MADETITIGELARRTGVAPSALRYYEELGLVRPAARVSGRRRYGPEAVGVVGAILVLADVGFTLAEVEQFVAARSESPGSWRELTRRKLAELDERIAEAVTARVAVEHAIDCPHDDIATCPNFQAVVRQRLDGRRVSCLCPDRGDASGDSSGTPVPGRQD
ncbi:MAG TPA: MerR family transcriptional regulator [Acidimicrobiia bacterium]|nr:MerR family transcriptional regulator [Acidimicrobiia bacterium]